MAAVLHTPSTRSSKSTLAAQRAVLDAANERVSTLLAQETLEEAEANKSTGKAAKKAAAQDALAQTRRALVTAQAEVQRLEQAISYKGAWLAAQQRWRKASARAIAAVPAAQCDLGLVPRLRDLRLMADKGSVSATVIAFGKLQATASQLTGVRAEDRDDFDQVALKISFRSLTEDNSLDFEREIIMQAFSRMLDHGWCPHVVSPLANLECVDGIPRMGSPQLESTMDKLVRDIDANQDEVDVNREVHVLMMGRGTGSLAQLMDKASEGAATLTDKDFWGILFQMYYTLDCQERLGIRHNDLHLGNILYKELQAPEDLFYEIETPDGPRLVHLTTRFLVLCFDEDRGSCVLLPGVPRNTALDFDYCADFGECSSLYSRYDVAAFNMSIMDCLADLWDVNKPEGRREHPAVVRWFDFMQQCLFDRSIWIEYGSESPRLANLPPRDHFLPQTWMHVAETDAKLTPQQRRAIPGMGNPERALSKVARASQCMLALVANGKVRTAAADDLRGYALGEPYRPPAQVRPEFGRPRQALLGTEQYRDVKPLTLIEKKQVVQQPAAKGFVEMYRNASEGDLSSWIPIFDQWKQELKEDLLPTVWEDKATELLAETLKKTRRYPGSDLQMAYLKVACLTLTCPFYYGLEPRIRRRMRRAFFDSDDAASSSGVLGAELFIWQAFGGQLNVEIPLLYNLPGI